jgi:long-chain acyl-CoA synthetase
MKQDIIDVCQRYLIRWSVPKEVEFRESLPKTTIGKTDFRKMQEEEDLNRGIKI